MLKSPTTRTIKVESCLDVLEFGGTEREMQTNEVPGAVVVILFFLSSPLAWSYQQQQHSYT